MIVIVNYHVTYFPVYSFLPPSEWRVWRTVGLTTMEPGLPGL